MNVNFVPKNTSKNHDRPKHGRSVEFVQRTQINGPLFVPRGFFRHFFRAVVRAQNSKERPCFGRSWFLTYFLERSYHSSHPPHIPDQPEHLPAFCAHDTQPGFLVGGSCADMYGRSRGWSPLPLHRPRSCPLPPRNQTSPQATPKLVVSGTRRLVSGTRWAPQNLSVFGPPFFL